MEAIFIQGLKRKVTDTTVRDSKNWKDLKKNAIANDRRKKIDGEGIQCKFFETNNGLERTSQ